MITVESPKVNGDQKQKNVKLTTEFMRIKIADLALPRNICLVKKEEEKEFDTSFLLET